MTGWRWGEDGRGRPVRARDRLLRRGRSIARGNRCHETVDERGQRGEGGADRPAAAATASADLSRALRLRWSLRRRARRLFGILDDEVAVKPMMLASAGYAQSLSPFLGIEHGPDILDVALIIQVIDLRAKRAVEDLAILHPDVVPSQDDHVLLVGHNVVNLEPPVLYRPHQSFKEGRDGRSALRRAGAELADSREGCCGCSPGIPLRPQRPAAGAGLGL
jgi:hypothetical protein